MPSNSILNIKKDGEWIEIPALKGEDGFSPTATVEKVGKVATITITDINGTTSATIADGTGSGGSGEENTIESISVNGTPISIDENKNVDITVPKVTNDLTDELKSSYDEAVAAKHTHDNKTVLDGITSDKVTAWDTVNNKVDKVDGKGLSTEDYTTDEKNKLSGIADGANKTIVDSALDASSDNPVQNKVIAGEINTLKKSVSDGKTLVATAITDKGVETAADATFAVMAENIGQIETGGGELHGATISVTTSEETLIGKTITLSLNDTVVATRTFDDNGACSFTDIQEAGTYSLYSTDGTDSATIPVDITAENVVNKTVISCEFYLTPDGETITPVDDVAILLKCAEIKDKSYTTMDELLADEQAMGDITMSENAMKYLARSTGFADAVCANETFMTLLGQSAYVDATVLNSDLWKQKIKASQYWTLVYASKTVTVYGGAYETITIDGYYGSFTTNEDGSVSHVVPVDTITLTGSVSGQSFERTVTSETTEVYAMPEGSLYWYGNSKTIVTLYGSPTIKTNEIYLYASNNSRTGVIIEDLVSPIYNSLHVKYYASNIVGSREDHGFNIELIDQDKSTYLWAKSTHNAGNYNATYDISSVTSEGYITLNFNTYVGYSGYCSIYEVWVE